MILIAPVEQHHIRRSARISPANCALARAIKQSHPDLGRPHVLANTIVITDLANTFFPRERMRFSTSSDVRNFIVKHTSTTFQPHPFTLVLDTETLTAFRFDSTSHLVPMGINWWTGTD